MRKKNNSNLTNIIAYTLIGAISFVVMKIEFPIFPGASFLKFDFSDVIVAIGTFLFGAWPGILIALIRTILSFIFNPSNLIGQIAAFLATTAYVLPFYAFSKKITDKSRQSLKGHIKPIIGLILGIVAMTIVMSVANAFILTPIYALTAIPNFPSLSSYQDLYNFTVKNYLAGLLHIPSMQVYIFGIIVPFNLLKGLINSIVVYILFEATLKNIKPFVQKRFNIK